LLKILYEGKSTSVHRKLILSNMDQYFYSDLRELILSQPREVIEEFHDLLVKLEGVPNAYSELSKVFSWMRNDLLKGYVLIVKKSMK